jgi:hypothetical protein
VALLSGLLRETPPVFGPHELHRRARAVIEAVDNETGDRRHQSRRIATLYQIARDIQQAGDHRAKDITVWEYVKFLGAVVANRWFVGQYKRQGVLCAGGAR